MYGKGISKEGIVVDIGSELEVISRSGSWYSYKGDRIGQGRENAKLFLAQNPAIMEEIEKEIKDIFQTRKISLNNSEPLVNE